MTSASTLSPSSAPRDDTVVVRLAVAADAPVVERLALLDSAPAPLGGTVLVAEQDGEIRAARSVEQARAVADPFRPTAHLSALLATRAALLRGPRRGPSRRARLLRRRAGALAAR